MSELELIFVAIVLVSSERVDATEAMKGPLQIWDQWIAAIALVGAVVVLSGGAVAASPLLAPGITWSLQPLALTETLRLTQGGDGRAVCLGSTSKVLDGAGAGAGVTDTGGGGADTWGNAGSQQRPLAAHAPLAARTHGFLSGPHEPPAVLTQHMCIGVREGKGLQVLPVRLRHQARQQRRDVGVVYFLADACRLHHQRV